MSTRFACLVASIVVVGSAACGDKDKEMTEAEFCPQYARTECTTVGERCVASTNDACIVARTAACQTRAASWKTASRPFSAKSAEACLEKLKSTYALFLITTEQLKTLDDTCARVYQGTAAANAACTVDHDCQGTLICDKGLCGTKKVVAAGAGCANVGEVCPVGQTCQPAAQGLRLCQARAGANMPCSATLPCLESLRCDGTSCVARLPRTSACTQHEECELPSGYCDPYARICAPGLSFALGSDSCRAFMSGITGPAPDAGPVDAASAADSSDPVDTAAAIDTGADL